MNAAPVITGALDDLKPASPDSDDYNEAVNLAAVNLLDPVLSRSYAFDYAVTDIAYFDNYLAVALGEGGVDLVDMDNSEEHIRISTSAELQDIPAKVTRVNVIGNLLFMAGETGSVVVVSLNDPEHPEVISAGNNELAFGSTVYKNRLLLASGEHGITAMELPGAFVTATSADADGGISLNEEEALTVTFNEAISIASVSDDNAYQLVRHSDENNQTIAVDAQWTALNGRDGSATQFAVQFDREPGEYTLTINDLETIRGTNLWVPHVEDFTVYNHEVRMPVIHYLQNNQIATDDVSTAVVIKGAHFADGSLQAQIDSYNVSLTVIDDETAQIPDGTLQMLNLQAGEHHLLLSNNGRRAFFAGAVFYTESPQDALFRLDISSGGVAGGYEVTASSGKNVFQPGTKVRFVSRVTGDVIETLSSEDGYSLVDLEDDVLSMNSFRFRAPGVTYPGIYDVYAVMPAGAGEREVLMGQFSYSRGTGHDWSLPNYPPMKVGGVEQQDQYLLVGVKDGQKPTAENRFLMKYGFEFYDVSIPDRAVRLAQVTTSAPVYGVTMLGNQAFLAGDTAGLHIVDIADKKAPLLVTTQSFSGLKAMDVAIRREQQVLALALVDPLGGGYIRFMDLTDENMLAPSGYSTLNFVASDDDPDVLQGQPVDIAWQDGKLHVLHKAGNQIILTVFTGLGTADVQHTSTTLTEISGGAVDELSMYVESGQVHVANASYHYVYQLDDNDQAEVIYWQQREDGGELFVQGGQLLSSDDSGFVTIHPHQLAVTAITPVAGSVVSDGSSILVQFNSLIDTSAETISQYVSLTDASGSLLSADLWQAEAVNTIRGAQIRVTLSSGIAAGDITLHIGSGLKDLDGLNLARAVNHTLVFAAQQAPQISAVNRLQNGVASGHYFHGDGNETASISGHFFAAPLTVAIGNTTLADSAVEVISADEIRIDMPDLHLGDQTRSLNVSVADDNGRTVLNGAVVVMPRSRIETFDPLTGPPRGGNSIDIYGSGFNRYVQVTIGDNPASDLRLINANHIIVSAPSGTFGYQTVRIENPYFSGETAQAEDQYFYAGQPVGKLDMPAAAPSPVSAITYQNQLLYAVTGGSFTPRDREGVQKTALSNKTARLLIANTSDPVAPELVEKTIADETLTYHFEAASSDGIFVDVEADGDLLVAAAEKRFFIFDLTLPADPLLLKDIATTGTIRDVLIYQGLVFIAHSMGIDIYRQQDDDFERVGSVSNTDMSGSAYRLQADGYKLWVVQTIARRVISLDMRTSDYSLLDIIETVNNNGRRIRPYDFIALDKLYLVATGPLATVQVYQDDLQQGGQLAGEARLEYLIANGDMSADRIQLKGQTLYVAAQEGDVQLFNISDWLFGDFSSEPTLDYYYSVMGNTTSLVVEPTAIYAGSVYGLASGEAIENPYDDTVPSQASGQLATIENELFVVMDQYPEVGGTLMKSESLSLTVNRVVNELTVNSDSVKLYRSGDAVPVSFSTYVTNGLSRITITPDFALNDGSYYELVVSEDIQDIYGTPLHGRYRSGFIYRDHLRPQLEEVSSRYVNWKGGDTLDMYGTGFYEGMSVQIGNVWLSADQIEWISDTHIRITLPQLTSASEENQLISIALGDEENQEVSLGQINVVANPSVSAAGKYRESNQTVNSSVQVFAFNGLSRLAVSGKGFGPFTQVTVNGNAADNMELVRDDLITFDQPYNTLGTLTIELTNDGRDFAQDESLSIELMPSASGLVTTTYVRDGDLLAAVTDEAGKTVQLFSTDESDIPSFLSSVSLSEAVKHLALADGYLYALLKNSAEVRVYDISNVYVPKLVNTITNPERFSFSGLKAVRRHLIGWNKQGIYSAHTFGKDWSYQSSAEDIIDLHITARYAFALTATSIIKHSLDANAETEVFAHAALTPQAMILDHDLAAINDGLRVYWVDLSTGAGLGATQLPQDAEMSLNGELLVVSSPAADQHIVYDVNFADNGNIELEKVTAYDADDATLLHLHNGLIEWLDKSALQHVRLPLLAATPDDDVLLSSSSADVAFDMTESHANWTQILLRLYAATGESVDGVTRLVGESLIFEAFAGELAAQSAYRMGMEGTVEQYVDGITLLHDRRYHYHTSIAFDIEEPEVNALEPYVMTSAAAREITVNGRHFDSVSELRIGTQIIDLNSVERTDSTLRFSYQPDGLGLKALHLTNEAGTFSTPAAFNVVQPLNPVTVVSDLPDPATVSDTGGDTITLTLNGAGTGLKVYWIPAEDGFVPEESFLMDYQLNGDRLTFNIPARDKQSAYKTGRLYHVIVIREITAEQVESATLTVIDNTAPRITAIRNYTYDQPLTIEADEALTISDYQVIRTLYANGNVTATDVTEQFELVYKNNQKTLEIGNRDGSYTDHNSVYRFVVRGLTDLAGNLPVGNGQKDADGNLVATTTTYDREAPSNIRLLNAADGEEVSTDAAFKRAKVHCLQITAEDNMVGSDRLTYYYRVSTDQGLNYGAELDQSSRGNNVCASNQIQIAVGIEQSDLTLKLMVSDGNQSSEKVVSVPLVDPQIDLAGFTTDPETIEEVGDSVLQFAISGDIELIDASAAVIEVQQRGVWRSYSTEVLRSDSAATISASLVQPKLEDMVLGYQDAQEAEIPVRVIVPFGIDGQKVFSASYVLHKDVTPPEVRILSPEDGGYIPWDMQLDVLIRFFDRYGVEKVEASINDGEWFTLAQPNRLAFTPTEEDYPGDINIRVRALDPNGNLSVEPSVANGAEITVTPYDADLGEPALRLLEPANGDTVKERTQLTALVEMQNLEEATVQFLISGDEEHADNPPPQILSQPDKETVRIPVVFDVPAVDGSVAAVIRLISDGHIRSQAFINIEDDELLGSTPLISSEPLTQLLNGTDLSVSAVASPVIDDQADTSFLRIDGTVSSRTFDFAEENILTNVRPADRQSGSESASQLLLTAHLEDHSGNYAEERRALNILPYFTAEEVSWLTLTPGLEQSVALNYSADLGTVALINNAYGGFRIETSNAGSWRVDNGSADSLITDGRRVYISYDLAGEHRVQMIQWLADTAQLSGDWLFDADMLSVNGNVIIARSGNTLTAWQLQGGGLTPVAGYSPGNIISAELRDGRLWVLTETALTELALADTGDLFALQEINRFNQHRYQGMAVSADGFAFFNGASVDFYQLTDGLLESTGQYIAAESVVTVQADRKGWWLQLNNGSWNAVRDNIQAALWQRPQQLLVAPEFVAYLSSDAIYTRQLETAVADEPVITVSTENTGYRLVSDRLVQLAAYTQDGEQLDLFRLSADAWLLPYVQGLSQVSLTYQGSTDQGALTIALDEPVSADSLLISPDSASLALKGYVPVTMTAAEGENLTVVKDADGNRLAPLSNLGWLQWLQVAETNTQNIYAADNLVTTQWTGNENISTGRIDILAPENNSAVQESSAVQVRFASNGISEVRYSRILLEDFNGEILREVYVAGGTGDLELTLPPLALAANFYVRVQTYFGDEFNYTESRVALKGVPDSRQVSAALDVPYFVAAGAELALSREESNLTQTGLLLLENDSGDILASGENALAYSVPQSLSRLLVRSYVNDGKGNTDTRSYTVSVLAPAVISASSAQAAFTLAIPLVGETLYVRDREVQDDQGQSLIEVSQPIKDAVLIGRRIAVLTSEGIFIFDPELDYQQVADHPFTGLKGLRTNGHYLWSWSANRLYSFTLFGNDLLDKTSKALTEEISAAVISDGALLYISGNSVWRNNSSLKTFTQSPVWLTEHMGDFWLQTDNGDLYRMRSETSGFSKIGQYDLAVQGLSLAGQLVLVSESGRLQWLNTELSPELQNLGIGDYGVTAGERLWISNGQLLSGDGKHWAISGDELTRPAFIDGQKAGGSVKAMEWWQGRLYVAAAHYGAYNLTYDQSSWQRNNLSAAYSERVEQLAVNSSGLFLVKNDAQTLRIKTSPAATEKTLISGLNPQFLAVGGELIAVSDGITIRVADGNGKKQDVSLESGASVTAITWSGNVLWVAADDGNLYEIYFAEWPISAYDIRQYKHALGLTTPVKQLQAEGDRIWLRQSTALSYYTLSSGELNPFALSGAVNISQIKKQGALLWAAYETDDITVAEAISLTDLQLSGTRFEYDTEITAIAAQAPYLAVGFVDGSVTVEHLPLNKQPPAAEVSAPSRRQTFAYGDYMLMNLNSAGWSAASVDINGTEAYTFSGIQAYEDLVPGSLLNGQPVNFSARVQDQFGQIITGTVTQAFVQSRSLPASNIEVDLQFPQISYYPADMKIEAVITQADQPVQMVEYYMSANESGPYELIAKHYGPQFVIYRNFGIEKDGYWIKARAIDIYGNLADSSAQQIQRQLDAQAPEASILLSGAPVVNQNKVITDENYRVTATGSDGESGVQSLMLYRDGQLKSAVFDLENLNFADITRTAGQPVDYRIVAVDYAGNQGEISNLVEVIQNQPPQITLLQINSLPLNSGEDMALDIIEGDSLILSAHSTDDVSMQQVNFNWLGSDTSRQVSGKSAQVNVSLKDTRTERQSVAEVHPLVITLQDGTGRESVYEVAVTITRDEAPDMGQLTVTPPESVIYGEQARVYVSGFDLVDDAGKGQLRCQVIDVSEEVIKNFPCRDGYVDFTVTEPEQGNRDTYHFALRATDRFSQSAQTAMYQAQATTRPNLVRFTGTADTNPAFITPDDQPLYEVAVEDDHSRGVSGQAVTWYLQARTANAEKQLLGESTTGLDGRAQWALNSHLAVGTYLLYAEAAKRYKLQPATFVVNVEAGEVSGVLVNYINVLEAGSSEQINLALSDAAGNLSQSEDSYQFTLTLPTGFHLALGADGDISVNENGQETVTLLLTDESVPLQLSATEVAGDYIIKADTELAVYSYQNDVFTQNSALPVTVTPAAVNQILVSFLRDDYLENPGSIKGVEETGDVLYYSFESVDRFGNRTVDELSYVMSENGSNLTSGEMQGLTEISLSFSDAGEHTLRLDIAGPYAFLSRAVILDIKQRGPGLISQSWSRGTETYRPVVNLVFNEAITIDNLADITELAEILDVELDETISVASATADENVLSITLADDTYQDKNYRLLKEDLNVESAETAAPYTAETPDAYLSLKLPQFYLAADNAWQVEGETLPLEAVTVYDSCSAYNVFNGEEIHIADTEVSLAASFVCSEGHYTWDMQWANVPFTEGEVRTLWMSASLFADMERPQIGNSVDVVLLSRDGDYDEDGLPNLFEHINGFDPMSADTDGNGVNDGEEDADHDGLSNATEISYGSDWSIADTDGDGLTDSIEYQLGTIAWGTEGLDSDNDGISDYVEYASLSDPTNSDEKLIDPFFVEQLLIADESKSFTLNGSSQNYQPQVSVYFNDDTHAEWIDVTGMTDLYTLSSNDLSVATVDAGSDTAEIIGEGETTLQAWLIELPDVSASVAIAVTVDTGPDFETRLVMIDPGYEQAFYRGVSKNMVMVEFVNVFESMTINAAWINGNPVGVDTSVGKDHSHCENGKAINCEFTMIDLKGKGNSDGDFISRSYLSGENLRFILFTENLLPDNLNELVFEIDVSIAGDEKSFSMSIPVIENKIAEYIAHEGSNIAYSRILNVINDDPGDVIVELLGEDGKPIQAPSIKNIDVMGTSFFGNYGAEYSFTVSEDVDSLNLKYKLKNSKSIMSEEIPPAIVLMSENEQFPEDGVLGVVTEYEREDGLFMEVNFDVPLISGQPYKVQFFVESEAPLTGELQNVGGVIDIQSQLHPYTISLTSRRWQSIENYKASNGVAGASKYNIWSAALPGLGYSGTTTALNGMSELESGMSFSQEYQNMMIDFATYNPSLLLSGAAKLQITEENGNVVHSESVTGDTVIDSVFFFYSKNGFFVNSPGWYYPEYEEEFSFGSGVRRFQWEPEIEYLQPAVGMRSVSAYCENEQDESIVTVAGSTLTGSGVCNKINVHFDVSYPEDLIDEVDSLAKYTQRNFKENLLKYNESGIDVVLETKAKTLNNVYVSNTPVMQYVRSDIDGRVESSILRLVMDVSPTIYQDGSYMNQNSYSIVFAPDISSECGVDQYLYSPMLGDEAGRISCEEGFNFNFTSLYRSRGQKLPFNTPVTIDFPVVLRNMMDEGVYESELIIINDLNGESLLVPFKYEVYKEVILLEEIQLFLTDFFPVEYDDVFGVMIDYSDLLTYFDVEMEGVSFIDFDSQGWRICEAESYQHKWEMPDDFYGCDITHIIEHDVYIIENRALEYFQNGELLRVVLKIKGFDEGIYSEIAMPLE